MGLKIWLILALASVSLPSTNAEGYFGTIYESLIQAQETLKEVAVTVNKGMKTLAQTLKFVEKFVDSTVEEECYYKCPKNKIPVANPNHTPDSNGCGSLGVFFDEKDLPRPEMVDCCNSHDICYDTCGSDKEDCDRLFKKCLYSTCNTHEHEMDSLTFKACKGGAKILFTTTLALGCTSYQDSQEQACICVEKEDLPRSRNEL